MFNPFGKPLCAVESCDLAVLKTVCEGWWVEYKTALTDAKKAAKQLAAFANTYGGWLFVGIGADDGGDETAQTFPGLSDKQANAAQQLMRQAVAQICDPGFFFETRRLTGPVPSIGLAADRHVLVVRVPASCNPPHVLLDGHVYRRVAAAAEPTARHRGHEPVNSRAELDEMNRRGQQRVAEVRRRIAWRDDLASPGERAPHLQVHVLCDPYGADVQVGLDFSTLVELFRPSPDRPGISLPFDAFHPLASGFVARCGSVPHLDSDLPAVFVDQNGTVTVSAPLAAHIDRGYAHGAAFRAFLARSGNVPARLLDLN